MAGPDPGTPAFGRWQQRLDDAVAGLLRDTKHSGPRCPGTA